jgi:hypothetical protein
MNHSNSDDLLQFKEIPSSLRRSTRLAPERASEISEEIRKARSSWYALWYKALQISEEYKQCCRLRGKGRLKDLYEDFGDVIETRFETWWQRNGRYIFSERRAIPKVESYTSRRDLDDIGHLREKIVLEVPLTIRKSTVVRQINKILKEAYEGRVIVPRNQSTAKRKLTKSKIRKETVKQMLDLIVLRAKYPELTLWQLGEKAGIDIDLYSKTTEVVLLTKQQERVRLSIAVSRLLRLGRNLIWNATEGVFPSTKPLV